MTDALNWAQTIHDYLTTANINAWVWGNISNLPQCGGQSGNGGLTDYNGDIPMRAYATGNWSKFIRPGWHRVGVTNSGSLLTTAFQSADNSQSAVVVVNSSSADINQVFAVGAQMGTSVVPWITSSTQSLAQQTAVTISEGLLTYTVPANSVVTFVGQATN
jgi:glucuronoarabinoxylan endo-1,4-beta-xylanase